MARGLLLAANLGGVVACSLPDIALPTEPEPVDPPCVIIPPSRSMLGYRSEVPDGAYWQFGCYNPANANEAVMLADLPDLAAAISGHALYRLNLLTGQKTLLFDGVTGSTVEWSSTGWIAFLKDGEAWKIKANGDSARQFTSVNHALTHLEAWSPDGKLILCQRNAPTYAQTGHAIYTAQGAFVRLLPDASLRAYKGIGWSPDGRRLAYAGVPNSTVTAAPRLCLYDLATSQLDTIDALPRGYVGLTGVRWLPNGREVVWGASIGIGITDVQTRQTRLVRASCPITVSGGVSSHWLASPVPSPDGQHILVGRGDCVVSPTDSELLLGRSSFETMNMQGGQIRKVTP